MQDDVLRLDPGARERIRELQIPGEADLYLRLTDIFLTESQALLAELQRNVDPVHAGALRELAHKWKNNALAVGAMRLGKLCQDLEAATLAPEHDPSPQTIVRAMESEFREVTALLRPGAKANR